MLLVLSALSFSGPSQGCQTPECSHLNPHKGNETQAAGALRPHVGNWRACRGQQCCDMRGYTGCYVTASGSAEINATSLSFDSTAKYAIGYVFEVDIVTSVIPLQLASVFKLGIGKNDDGSFSGGFVLQRSPDPMDIWRENVTVRPLPK